MSSDCKLRKSSLQICHRVAGFQIHWLYKQSFKFTWIYSFSPLLFARFSTLCLPKKPLLLRGMFTFAQAAQRLLIFRFPPFFFTAPLRLRLHKNALQMIKTMLQAGTCSRNRPSKSPVLCWICCDFDFRSKLEPIVISSDDSDGYVF